MFMFYSVPVCIYSFVVCDFSLHATWLGTPYFLVFIVTAEDSLW